MTRQFQIYLNPTVSSTAYSCVHCRAHLADHNDLISKAFQGSQGRAYLFDKVINVKSANAEDRLLLTGQHRVSDLHCAGCNSLLGWKYERAFEASQRYKEGKYIIELAHLIKENRWTESYLFSSPSSGYQSGDATSPVGLPSSSTTPHRQRNDAFAVDSSGEDEAELLPAASVQHQRLASLPSLNANSECINTLHRTIKPLPAPDVTFEQTSPQLDSSFSGWNDLPLNDNCFLPQSLSTYDAAPTHSSIAPHPPLCLFHPAITDISVAEVPSLSVASDAEDQMEAGLPAIMDGIEVKETSFHRPTTLLPPTAVLFLTTEAVQTATTVGINSSGFGVKEEEEKDDSASVVYSAVLE